MRCGQTVRPGASPPPVPTRRHSTILPSRITNEVFAASPVPGPQMPGPGRSVRRKVAVVNWPWVSARTRRAPQGSDSLKRRASSRSRMLDQQRAVLGHAGDREVAGGGVHVAAPKRRHPGVDHADVPRIGVAGDLRLTDPLVELPSSSPAPRERDRDRDARQQCAWSHLSSMRARIGGRLTSYEFDTNMCSYGHNRQRHQPVAAPFGAAHHCLRAHPPVRPPGDPGRAPAGAALQTAGAGAGARRAAGGRGGLGARRGVRRARRDAPRRGARPLPRAGAGAAGSRSARRQPGRRRCDAWRGSAPRSSRGGRARPSSRPRACGGCGAGAWRGSCGRRGRRSARPSASGRARPGSAPTPPPSRRGRAGRR